MTSDRDETLTDQHEVDPADNRDLPEGEPDAAAGQDDAQADAATESLRDLVTYLVNNLVDEPESVEIDVTRRGPSVHIQLRLPEGELGKVIGRSGRIAKAIRTVLLIAGSKHHLRVSLDIES
jgi:predicted RNA-binding protein YlqC (UPF0109 family)